MPTFRWLLAVLTLLAAIGWVALGLLGDGFRRSFGASGNHPLKLALPPLIGLLLLLGLLFPAQRGVVMAGAAAACVLLVASLWLLRESAVAGTIGAGYAVAWLSCAWWALRPATDGTPPVP